MMQYWGWNNMMNFGNWGNWGPTMMNNWQNGGQFFWMAGIMFGFVLFALAVWTLFWKGMALWKAAQKGDKKWFVALLIINTLGILEILYLYVFSKEKK